MCGIAGIVTKNGSPPDEGMLRRMATAIAHRGPDGEGIWSAPGIGLAHRRLAILDLTSRGAQPMHDASGELTIVFNGEIYNYRDLKKELHVDWKSDSDTEVILEGYRVWGMDVLKRLRGMFAFAIWDGRTKKLIVARDRIGKKPLFYAETSDGFAFASEIKALAGITDFSPDWNDVRLFLGLQYVPSPRTGFASVRKLEPGCYGTFENETWKTERYHSWDQKKMELGSIQQMNERIRALLDESVKIRLESSDVPVGAFLSGGVDSAAVVAFASRHVSRPLQTFTMGFPNLAQDERKEAWEIASHFHTDHQEFEAKPENLVALIDTLVQQYDAPYADSSALPLWLLSQETAQEIKVVLTGDGGDEIFGGYRRYVAFQRALAFAKIPLSDAFAVTALQPMFTEQQWRRFFETVLAIHRNRATSYGELFCGSYFGSRGVRELCTKEFLEETKGCDAVEFVGMHATDANLLRGAMMFDLTSYLPDDLNVKMDRATMAFGLEARSPLLDQELVAYALSLPLNQKVVHGKTKVALKRALKGIVPDEVLDRKKRGFQVPLADWFRQDALRQLFADRCLSESSPLHRVCRPETVKRLFEENLRGADHGNRLWMLLALSTWISHYG